MTLSCPSKQVNSIKNVQKWEKPDCPWVCWECKACHSHPGTGATSWAAETWIKRFSVFLWPFRGKKEFRKTKNKHFAGRFMWSRHGKAVVEDGIKGPSKKKRWKSTQVRSYKHSSTPSITEGVHLSVFLAVVPLQLRYISVENVRLNSVCMQKAGKTFWDLGDFTRS